MKIEQVVTEAQAILIYCFRKKRFSHVRFFPTYPEGRNWENTTLRQWQMMEIYNV